MKTREVVFLENVLRKAEVLDKKMREARDGQFNGAFIEAWQLHKAIEDYHEASKTF